MRPGQYLTRSLVYAENRGIDGAVVGTAGAFSGLSARVRRWQTGFVRSYALTMLAGAGGLGRWARAMCSTGHGLRIPARRE
jgi:NADH-quinone oxidoreductase subunit L